MRYGFAYLVVVLFGQALEYLQRNVGVLLTADPDPCALLLHHQRERVIPGGQELSWGLLLLPTE